MSASGPFPKELISAPLIQGQSSRPAVQPQGLGMFSFASMGAVGANPSQGGFFSQATSIVGAIFNGDKNQTILERLREHGGLQWLTENATLFDMFLELYQLYETKKYVPQFWQMLKVTCVALLSLLTLALVSDLVPSINTSSNGNQAERAWHNGPYLYLWHTIGMRTIGFIGLVWLHLIYPFGTTLQWTHAKKLCPKNLILQTLIRLARATLFFALMPWFAHESQEIVIPVVTAFTVLTALEWQ